MQEGPSVSALAASVDDRETVTALGMHPQPTFGASFASDADELIRLLTDDGPPESGLNIATALLLAQLSTKPTAVRRPQHEAQSAARRNLLRCSV